MSKQKLKKILSTVLTVLVIAAAVYLYIQKNYGNNDVPDPSYDISVEPSGQSERPTDPPATVPVETEQERTTSEALTLTPVPEPSTETPAPTGPGGITVREDGTYTDRDHVALYLHLYGKLPSNFITKKDAQALGWNGGSLKNYAPGKSIGGDRFGNNEGKLPKKSDRKYYECDIDYNGGSRNAKRIVYSDDGLIFYTDDHYETFKQLY